MVSTIFPTPQSLSGHAKSTFPSFHEAHMCIVTLRHCFSFGGSSYNEVLSHWSQHLISPPEPTSLSTFIFFYNCTRAMCRSL
ncbi:hypothetical protein BS17DRAFT_783405 [Gyrodon lividus]|nr:hypothetical protein BS17DRAFT_783405 [Gyrodon lividus]